jgi:hypothetical protein
VVVGAGRRFSDRDLVRPIQRAASGDGRGTRSFWPGIKRRLDAIRRTLVLRRLAICNVVLNFGLSISETLYLLFAYKHLGSAPALACDSAAASHHCYALVSQYDGSSYHDHPHLGSGAAAPTADPTRTLRRASCCASWELGVNCGQVPVWAQPRMERLAITCRHVRA